MERIEFTTAPTTALLAKAAAGARTTRWRENLASQLESISRNAEGSRLMSHFDLQQSDHACTPYKQVPVWRICAA